jgi:hypothetical protein
VTGHVLTLDTALQDIIPALLALLDVALDDSSFLQLDPAQHYQRTLDALKWFLLCEARSNRCWSLRIYTGLMPPSYGLLQEHNGVPRRCAAP